MVAEKEVDLTQVNRWTAPEVVTEQNRCRRKKQADDSDDSSLKRLTNDISRDRSR